MAFLKDGYSTSITFTLAPSSGVLLHVKELTPPAVSLGVIDVTTMENSGYRTKVPKSLKTLGDVTFTAAYSPHAYQTIKTMMGTLQDITIHFPDAQTLTFEGWIDEFKPNRIVEGQQPTAEVTIKSSLSAEASTGQPTFPA